MKLCLLAAVGLAPERTELIRLTRGATLVAPSSVHWEIGNALSAMFKRKAIEFDDAVKVLEGHASIPIRLLDTPLRQAVELSRNFNIYAYNGAVEIRPRDGAIFRLTPAPKSKASPLDVPGVKLRVSTDELVAVVREERERSRR